MGEDKSKELIRTSYCTLEKEVSECLNNEGEFYDRVSYKLTISFRRGNHFSHIFIRFTKVHRNQYKEDDEKLVSLSDLVILRDESGIVSIVGPNEVPKKVLSWLYEHAEVS